jgi:amino acid transporter
MKLMQAIFETLGVATIFIFRKRMPDAPRLYRCPGYPWTPLVYFALPIYVTICMFIDSPPKAFLSCAGSICLGCHIYLLWEKSPQSQAENDAAAASGQRELRTAIQETNAEVQNADR